MKNSIGTGRGLLYMTLIMSVLLGIRHAELLQAPNTYFIGDSLDGFRSMAANFYHIQHDESYTHYLGTHYPYGDKAGMADLFLPLANAIKYQFKNDATWFPAIWNLSLIFSQLLCGVMLFLVFRELKLPVWFSIAAALGVSTLTPQIDRFATHYCLSFAFLLPMTIWLLIRFGNKPKLSLSVAIGLIPILANQIHPYHMAMVVFLIAGYFFFRFCDQPSWNRLKWLSSHALIQLVLPLTYLFLTVVWNDAITDRSAWPSGFTIYVTRLQSLLLPINLPLGSWIDANITDIEYVRAETRVYLGMVVLFGGLFLLFRSLFQKIRSTAKEKKNRLLNPALRYLMGAAFVILLYAACLPFNVLGWEWMTDYLGYLRQFRALGRFAWVFFYVSNVAVLYALFLLVEKLKKKHWRKFWHGLILSVLLLEGIGYIFWEQYELYPRPENREHFSRADNPWVYSLDLSEYQAILPIPFYHIGSENFWINPIGKHLHRTVWAGADTGLPVMGAFMNRTSLSQTINLIEAISEPYRRPAILDDFPDQRPLLVFISKDALNQIPDRYEHLVKGLTQLYEDEKIRLLAMPLSAFERKMEQKHQAYRTEVDTTTMYAHDAIWSKDSIHSFVYQSFDEPPISPSYQGGAKALTSKTDHLIYEGPLPEPQTTDPTIISFWSKMDYDLAPKSRMICTEYLPETGERLGITKVSFFEYIKAVDKGWMLIEIPIKLKRKDAHIKVIFKNDDLLYGEEFYLDEFQIRSANTRLYKKEKDWIMVNNRWIPQKSQK